MTGMHPPIRVFFFKCLTQNDYFCIYINFFCREDSGIWNVGNVVWCREGDISRKQCSIFTVRSQTFSDHFMSFSEKTIKFNQTKRLRK